MAKSSLGPVIRLPNPSSTYLPPLFLAPALAHLSLFTSTSRPAPLCVRPHPSSKTRPFSTTSSPQARPIRREKNKSRGVSAIRRTGPRVPSPIAKYELPQPVRDPPARKEFRTNPDHGLWGFFNSDKTAMSSPEEELAHGRAWTYAELSYKSFEVLHSLYWICVKERNRIATAANERARVFAGYGDYESQSRNREVFRTMSRIRRVLVDRYHSWQEAMTILNRTSVKDLRLDEEEAYQDEAEDHNEKEESGNTEFDAEVDELLDEKVGGKERQNAIPTSVAA